MLQQIRPTLQKEDILSSILKIFVQIWVSSRKKCLLVVSKPVRFTISAREGTALLRDILRCKLDQLVRLRALSAVDYPKELVSQIVFSQKIRRQLYVYGSKAP